MGLSEGKGIFRGGGGADSWGGVVDSGQGKCDGGNFLEGELAGTLLGGFAGKYVRCVEKKSFLELPNDRVCAKSRL